MAAGSSALTGNDADEPAESALQGRSGGYDVRALDAAHGRNDGPGNVTDGDRDGISLQPEVRRPHADHPLGEEDATRAANLSQGTADRSGPSSEIRRRDPTTSEFGPSGEVEDSSEPLDVRSHVTKAQLEEQRLLESLSAEQIADGLAAAQQAVLERLGPLSRALTDIVVRLLADHVAHGRRLNATEALLDPDRRTRTLDLLAELGRGAIMAAYADDLQAFLRAHPGAGPLFEPVASDVNRTPDQESRKRAFEVAARLREPARAIGPDPDIREQILLDDYGIRLQRRVQVAAEAEIRALADGLPTPARVSARTKKPRDLLDKVSRMRQGRHGRPARPDFSIGDVVDAVGVRLTVPDVRALESALAEVVDRFGTGDGGRILEIENMYASPKQTQPAYRVIPVIVSIEVDGLPYTYELQLTTERASLAADIEHNTAYKPYVVASDDQKAAVLSAMEEAAALDQLETVERGEHE